MRLMICVCFCCPNTVADNLHLMNFNKIDLLLNNSTTNSYMFKYKPTNIFVRFSMRE